MEINTGLNPFLIRAMVQIDKYQLVHDDFRLNPFLIRAMVQIKIMKQVMR